MQSKSDSVIARLENLEAGNVLPSVLGESYKAAFKEDLRIKKGRTIAAVKDNIKEQIDAVNKSISEAIDTEDIRKIPDLLKTKKDILNSSKQLIEKLSTYDRRLPRKSYRYRYNTKIQK